MNVRVANATKLNILDFGNDAFCAKNSVISSYDFLKAL
jgi:hypothetical protein